MTLRRARIARLLGDAVPDREVDRLLTHLGFGLKANDEGWDAKVPAFRVDVAREADLIEEVGRHWGFDRIPATFPPLRSRPRPVAASVERDRRLRRILCGAGLQEAVTFTFIERTAAVPFLPRRRRHRWRSPTRCPRNSPSCGRRCCRACSTRWSTAVAGKRPTSGSSRRARSSAPLESRRDWAGCWRARVRALERTRRRAGLLRRQGRGRARRPCLRRRADRANRPKRIPGSSAVAPPKSSARGTASASSWAPSASCNGSSLPSAACRRRTRSSAASSTSARSTARPASRQRRASLRCRASRRSSAICRFSSTSACLPQMFVARFERSRRRCSCRCASSIGIRARASPPVRSVCRFASPSAIPIRTLTDSEVQHAVDAIVAALSSELGATLRSK